MIGECAALVIIRPIYPANVFCAAAVDCSCSFCLELDLVTKFATSATRGGGLPCRAGGDDAIYIMKHQHERRVCWMDIEEVDLF